MPQPATNSEVPFQPKPFPMEPPKKQWPWLVRFALRFSVVFGVLTSPIWGGALLIAVLVSLDFGLDNSPAVAPNADFETRRAWGKNEMREYLEYAEKWARKSSLIYEDIGYVTKVAPIGRPNRFHQGGFTDGSYCSMNLQVIGTNGEGLLTLPKVYVNNMGDLYEISKHSTWKFGDETDVIQHSGKSFLQGAGIDKLVDQIQGYAAKKQYADVVATYEYLETVILDQLPFYYRADLCRQYSDSLIQLGRDEEASRALRREANLHLDRLRRLRRMGYQPPGELSQSLEATQVATMQALEIQPDDKQAIKLARQRVEIAHQIACGNFKKFASGEEAAERDAVQRSFGEFYDCVLNQAQKSDWLQKQLGTMDFRPTLNRDNQLWVNEHGLYSATVAVEITGRWGESGKLKMRIWEQEKKGRSSLDLTAIKPRKPSLPLVYSEVCWVDSSGKETKLAVKTLAPSKDKEK